MFGLEDIFSDKWLAFLWEQTVPLLADLFLYSYENEFLDKLVKKGKRKLAINFKSDIYAKELTISKATESTSVASYLDLPFTRNKNNNITTKFYDKREAFGFHNMNIPFMLSNIPSAPLMCLCISAHSLCPLLFKL